MTFEQISTTFVNEVVMMEELEVDLCLVCCSKVKSTKKDNLADDSSQLLSSNLSVFYLLRRVLQVTDFEFKKNLISCGNPSEWIRLCDKCTEFTRQAEELHRKLRRIERELSCIQQLIWEKARSSINSEDDRKLVEATIDLTSKTGQVWRRIRNHVANKCNLTKKNISVGVEAILNPFAEGDKLANYLITQKATTAILQSKQDEQKSNEEYDDQINLLEEKETNVEATSSSSSPLKIKMEVKPGLDTEEPQLPDITLDHQNYENLLIDSLLQELVEVKVDIEDQGGGDKEEDVNLEEMEVEEQEADKLLVQEHLENDKEEEEDADWNWEPDDQEGDNEYDDREDGDNEVDEDDEEELSSSSEGIQEDLKGKSPEKGSSASSSATMRRDKEKQVEKTRVNQPPSSQKRRSTYIKKGMVKRPKTEDGKIKCRHCDQSFASLSGCNSHEREKHSKTPGAFICDICGGAFNSRDYLRKHKKRTHKLKPDGTWENRKNRKIIRTSDGKYQCPQCDQIFASSSACGTHQNEKHSKTPGAFVCDICGRAFNSSSYLRSHTTCSHKLKPDGTPIPPRPPKLEKDHMCDQCGKGFSTPRHLKKHVRFVHEKRFDIKCTLCGTGWASKNSLKKHMLAVHQEDPSTKKLIEEEGLGLWKCPVSGCTAKFLKESSVKGHLQSRHGKNEEQIDGLDFSGTDAQVVLDDPSVKATCQKCGKICRNKFALKKHEELHENKGKAKEFFCETCGAGFVTMEYLKYHVDRVHLKKGKPTGKDFKCEICGKAYERRYLLKDHLELHEREGKREYFCDKCGHGFITEKYLRNHIRVTNCGVEGKQARVYNRKSE